MTQSRVAQLCSLNDMRDSWRVAQSRRGKAGSDGVTVDAFAAHAEEHIAAFAEAVPAPLPALAFDIPKGNRGTREVVRLTVQDRVLEGAAVRALDRVLSKQLHADAYAYRPGRSALEAVTKVSRAALPGTWVVRLDIKDCFPSIPHDLLLKRLSPVLSERAFIDLHGMVTRPVKRGRTVTSSECGLLEGSLLSPLLSNWFLTPLDEALAGEGHMVRYADDIVVLVPDPLAAGKAVSAARDALGQLRLHLNDTKTKVSPTEAGFHFLGFSIAPGNVRVAPDRLEAVKDELAQRLAAGDTVGVQQLLQGWKAYYRLGQVGEDLKLLDAWLAGRKGAPRLDLHVEDESCDYVLPRVSKRTPAPATQSQAGVPTSPKKEVDPVKSPTPGPAAGTPPVNKDTVTFPLHVQELLDLARTLAVQTHPAAQAAALMVLRSTADPSLTPAQMLATAKASARAQLRPQVWSGREAACQRLQAELCSGLDSTLSAVRAERLTEECIDPLLRVDYR